MVFEITSFQMYKSEDNEITYFISFVNNHKV